MRSVLLVALLGVLGCSKPKAPLGPFEGEVYRVKKAVLFEPDPAALRLFLDEKTTMHAKQKLRERPVEQRGGILTPGRLIQVKRPLDDLVVECYVPPPSGPDMSPERAKTFPHGWLYIPRFAFVVPGHLDKLARDKAKKQ